MFASPQRFCAKEKTAERASGGPHFLDGHRPSSLYGENIYHCAASLLKRYSRISRATPGAEGDPGAGGGARSGSIFQECPDDRDGVAEAAGAAITDLCEKGVERMAERRARAFSK